MKRNSTFRRIGFLIILSWNLLLTGTISFAQSKVQAGPIWGQGMRMITGNEVSDIGMGFHGGLIVRVPFNDQLSITPSIAYARKGYNKFDFGFWNEDLIIQYNQKLSYLDFYFPVKYQVAGIFNIQAGVQLGVLLDGELILESYSYSEKFRDNIKNELNPVDFGFILGAGVQFKNGIGLDLILNQGLTDIYKNDPIPYVDPYNNSYIISELNGKNMLTTINISYLFGYAPVSVPVK
ncbi:MAG: PorT family protein [Bacteroidetes bacterium]|nr:PorT family protein [Bacteroidota bacterium]